MTEPARPDLLIVGPPQHGVVRYAREIADAVLREGGGPRIIEVDDAETCVEATAGSERVHLHVTDRLFGRTPDDAASAIERLATTTRLSMTLHDLPQESDGRSFTRRVDAYRRFVGAAAGVAVNSAHEALLAREHLGLPEGAVHVVPLGVSRARPDGAGDAHPDPDADVDADSDADAVVRASRPDDGVTALIAGFVYPGKGHAEAIHAVADATAALRARGLALAPGAVVAIGGPSAGHEPDLAALRSTGRERGVEFRLTGFLSAADYRRQSSQPGIPLAAHQHVSASRSMIDWIELGRRPLVRASRYSREMSALRPGTMTLYAPHELSERMQHAWLHPETTQLRRDTDLSPTLADAASAYGAWWARLARA